MQGAIESPRAAHDLPEGGAALHPVVVPGLYFPHTRKRKVGNSPAASVPTRRGVPAISRGRSLHESHGSATGGQYVPLMAKAGVAALSLQMDTGALDSSVDGLSTVTCPGN